MIAFVLFSYVYILNGLFDQLFLLGLQGDLSALNLLYEHVDTDKTQVLTSHVSIVLSHLQNLH